MLKHLNLLRQWAYDLAFFMLWKYINALKGFLIKCAHCRRRSRVFRSWCLLFSVFLGVIVGAALGAIFIVAFLITLLILVTLLCPFMTLLLLVIRPGTNWTSLLCKTSGCTICAFCWCCCFCAVSIWLFCMFVVIYFTFIVVFLSGAFVVQIFSFTVMGLVLNAELLSPYVAFILVVTRNLYLCYSNLQSRYKQVKEIISKHWKENARDLPLVHCSNDETIPKDLFWFVCGKGKSRVQQNVLPLRAEICFMLRDMALMLVFLVLSLYAILMFKSMNDTSALVSTIFVFVSGVIPSLIFAGFTTTEKFSGWNKINIERKIKEAVKKYLKTLNENAVNDDFGSAEWFFHYGGESSDDLSIIIIR